jgi:putative membrane protein
METTVDGKTRLAFERTYLAHERTQMAWVRTSLALITFGFAIAKFYLFLDETRGDQAPYLAPRTVGMLMISVGLIALVFANVQHRRALKALRARCPDLPESIAGATAVVIMVLGVVAFAVALF